MLIDNTNKSKRVTGITNLTVGVWRPVTGVYSRQNILIYCSPLSEYSEHKHKIGYLREDRSLARLFIIGQEGSIRIIKEGYVWNDTVFEFVSKTMDFVVPGQDG